MYSIVKFHVWYNVTTGQNKSQKQNYNNIWPIVNYFDNNGT